MIKTLHNAAWRVFKALHHADLYGMGSRYMLRRWPVRGRLFIWFKLSRRDKEL
jgi:hypothetical protein